MRGGADSVVTGLNHGKLLAKRISMGPENEDCLQLEAPIVVFRRIEPSEQAPERGWGR